MTYFQAIANQLQEAIDRVRELHKPIPLHDLVNEWKICSACFNDLEPHLYPCPTIKALDNEVR